MVQRHKIRFFIKITPHFVFDSTSYREKMRRIPFAMATERNVYPAIHTVTWRFQTWTGWYKEKVRLIVKKKSDSKWFVPCNKKNFRFFFLTAAFQMDRKDLILFQSKGCLFIPHIAIHFLTWEWHLIVLVSTSSQLLTCS